MRGSSCIGPKPDLSIEDFRNRLERSWASHTIKNNSKLLGLGPPLVDMVYDISNSKILCIKHLIQED